MKIILIEDDEFKAKQIITFLEKKGYEVILRKAFNTGMKTITTEKFDLALLDMTIPSFEISPEHPSSRTRKYGGKDILSEIERCEIDLPSIIVTQYRVFDDGEVSLEKIDMELTQEFNQIYYGIVYYNSSTMDWQDKLIDLIENIQK
jgi:DNA-binding NtrC family response regulator